MCPQTEVDWQFSTNEMRCSDIAAVGIGIYATVFANHVAANSTAVNCSCGYYDATTRALWTESIITYFNETTALPIPSFIEESYSHRLEKGWNTQFRTGADVSNIKFSNFTSAPKSPASLELQVSPYRSDHLVVGSSLRTSRRDIQYGSFTFLLRSPGKSAGGGGSVLSVALEYNSSQSISMNLQNTDTPSTAYVTTLENEESPDTSVIQYSSMTNGSFGNGTLSPWDYSEYRLEWTKARVNFFIGDTIARSISRSEKEGLLSVPGPLYLRHWSNGLAAGSQGPPKMSTVANVGWLRMFFNSSLMTDDEHSSFNERCRTSIPCRVSDMTLRESSVCSKRSAQPWKQAPLNAPRRPTAIWLAVSCISLTALLLLRPIWMRVRETLSPAQEVEMMFEARRESVPPSYPKPPSPAGLGINFMLDNKTAESSIDTLVGTNQSTPTIACFNPSRPSSASPKRESSRTFRRRSTYPVDQSSSEDDSHTKGQKNFEQKALSDQISPNLKSSTKEPNQVAPLDNIELADYRTEESNKREMKLSPTNIATTSRNWQISWHNVGWSEIKDSAQSVPLDESSMTPEIIALESPKRNSNVNKKATAAFPCFPEGQQRMDHFAGLIVVSCVLVTAINFNLTFVYGDLMPEKFTHYQSEEIARKTIISFVLNPIWIGPFLLTSARFLMSSYLRNGDLLVVAEKLVKRTFRLMLPVTAMVVLEYFFIDCSATKWLEYLPSITWSTWPFIRGYSNFGNFMSEILELVYLIPNAFPVITFNFCTNVLWSIPIQLQGSWTTLLATIVILEIKTPWKRFCFYAFCIVNHWYALSWGSYFYFGIMLTDLDITYKWQAYLHARPVLYYPLLSLCVCCATAGPTLDLLTQRIEIDYAAYEYGIHPNLTSGLSISESGGVSGPMYFSPRLNGLVFAVGLQAAVELSTLVQKFFSLKLFMLIFPHVYTIYLLHGFIFWTFGSWLCAFLAVRGLSYWLNILIVALCCYAVLALSTPLVTPVLDSLGKSITTDIWREAREDPAPRYPTLYPFPRDLFLNREEVSWERKSSKDIVVDQQEKRVSRMISRVRKPSKDLRTSWYEQGASLDANIDPPVSRRSEVIPHDGKPTKDFRTSWHELRPSVDPRTSPPEGEPSDRMSWPEQRLSRERRISLQGGKTSPDFISSRNERKISRAGRLERVEDVEEAEV